jgi:hypothetical protein
MIYSDAAITPLISFAIACTRRLLQPSCFRLLCSLTDGFTNGLTVMQMCVLIRPSTLPYHRLVLSALRVFYGPSDVKNSDLKCFDNFITTLTKYQGQITNYFIRWNSSGFVEGSNNKGKVLKCGCYGLSNVAKLFQRLIIDTLGMDRFSSSAAFFLTNPRKDEKS